MDNRYQGMRIDEIDQAKREEDFLREVNRDSDVPPYYRFESVEEVINNHDCALGPDDGCTTCQLLYNWGFLGDRYDLGSEEWEYNQEESNV